MLNRGKKGLDYRALEVHLSSSSIFRLLPTFSSFTVLYAASVMHNMFRWQKRKDRLSGRVQAVFNFLSFSI